MNDDDLTTNLRRAELVNEWEQSTEGEQGYCEWDEYLINVVMWREDQVAQLRSRIDTLEWQLRCPHRDVVTQAIEGGVSACQRCGLKWRYTPAKREILP